MEQRRRAALIAVVTVIALVAGAGCRENEQDRPLDFQPHVYKGQKQPSLTGQQQRDLQERGNLQR